MRLVQMPFRLVVRTAVASTVAVLVFVACAAQPDASFDAAAPCTIDQRLAGAYPPLEAELPTQLFGVAPTAVDSGRNCTTKNLGSLVDHGVTELRFAGARWDRSARSGVTTVLFTADGLTAEWIGEWYEASARLSSKTAALQPSRPMVDGLQGYRLDLLASESPQAVIAWPGAEPGTVRVVIGAGVPEADVQAAIAAFR